MASNLRVDTILPSTGTSLGIGTASGTINFLGNSNITTTGTISAASLSVTGSLGIGGTLTYEDVTNIDSVGVITARQGVRVNVDGTSSANYISVGAGNDLKIWHQSSNNHSYISETGSGSLVVLADDCYIQDTSTNTMISAKEGAEVNLHFNGTKKLETSSSGAIVTGDFEATNDLILSGASANLRWDKSDDALEFMDNGKAVFGNGDDLKIFHDGSNSKITNATGHVIINTNSLDINNAADNETLAKFDHDGAVELYWDNVKQLETTRSGISLPKGVIHGMGNGSMAMIGGTINPSQDTVWTFPFNTNAHGTNQGYFFYVRVFMNHWNTGNYYKILEKYIGGRGNTTGTNGVTPLENNGGSGSSWNNGHFDCSIVLSGDGTLPASFKVTYDADGSPSWTSGYHICVQHSSIMGPPIIS